MTLRQLCSVLMFAPLILLAGADPATQPAERTTASGLKIVEIKVQAEPLVAKIGDMVWVHYTGRLQGKTEAFDSSLSPDRGDPIPFTIGTPGLIEGWQEGIQGMKVGDKRQLIIPPNLGYGAAGRLPKIPPNSVMVFDIELVGIYRK